MRTLIYTGLGPVTLQEYLQQQFPLLGPGRCNRFLRENKIKLNGKKQPLSTPLRPHDEIRLFIDEALLIQPDAADPTRFARPLTGILYEDDDLLAVDKPAGLPVSDESGRALDTLLLRAQRYLGDECDVQLCHRLDTGTSGVTLLAKNSETLALVEGLLQKHAIAKEYLCVTFGRPQSPQATLRGWLVKDAAAGRVYIQQNAAQGAKSVETDYETMAVSGRLALLKVRLHTGRTHQIRAHLAGIGCPILGDSKYGNNAANRELHLKYQALCAWQVTFPPLAQPRWQALSQRRITAPKPWYFSQVLEGTLR